jgi:hypothetical protein
LVARVKIVRAGANSLFGELLDALPRPVAHEAAGAAAGGI